MELAEIYGEPLWCKGTGMRHTHLRAIAPTVSNSKLSGNVSPGIEPWAANVFTEQSAKGTFIRKNPTLVKLLRKYKLNTNEIWDKILADGGSVQDISELDDIMLANEIPVKEVFKTFKEINQLELINQAGIRQQYIDQAQSLNIFFRPDPNIKYLHAVHFLAWKSKLKTLYYCRSEKIGKADKVSRSIERNIIKELDMTALATNPEECLACEG